MMDVALGAGLPRGKRRARAAPPAARLRLPGVGDGVVPPVAEALEDLGARLVVVVGDARSRMSQK